ncbi:MULTISPECIES: hypothetical protein [Kamptonema]|uniref:hypothetical protein n=1 Tax=Kamptonema TaxID=1501433 RepID=UPI0001DAD0D1|nr:MULTISPECIES: hypothetical protein [Kamptonema]CBN58220.1 hypothetical protein OSCI_3670003 [Kamptonema sp. PCC 6506]
MPYNQFLKSFLLGPKGLSPKFAKLLTANVEQVSLLRRTLLPILRDRTVTNRPKLSDFPELRTFRQILADIEGLPAPKPGFFDGAVVKEADYAQQATSRLISRLTEPKVLSLEETFNHLLTSKTRLTTGSNNTLEQALKNAEAFRNTLGIEEFVHTYLAMDMSWWLSGDKVLSLVGKNIVLETALIPAQAIVNEARLVNPSLELAIDVTHSYGNMPRASALNVHEAMSISEVRSIFLAPLATPENILPLLEAKNGFKGRISIVRPEFDPLEELALSLQEITLGVNYDLLPTDVRLNIGSHKLVDISKELKATLDKNKLDLGQFIDRNYTSRPGEVTYSTNSDGTLDKIVTPRTGEQYSQEAWRKQYAQLLEQQKSDILNQLQSQAKQLEALTEIAGMGSKVESLATSLADIKNSLDSSEPTTLYDIVTHANNDIANLTINISNTIAQAESSASSDWKLNMESLTQEVRDIEEKIEANKDEIKELESGAYEPEEG